jgi:hypothetical protein
LGYFDGSWSSSKFGLRCVTASPDDGGGLEPPAGWGPSLPGERSVGGASVLLGLFGYFDGSCSSSKFGLRCVTASPDDGGAFELAI